MMHKMHMRKCEAFTQHRSCVRCLVHGINNHLKCFAELNCQNIVQRPIKICTIPTWTVENIQEKSKELDYFDFGNRKFFLSKNIKMRSNTIFLSNPHQYNSPRYTLALYKKSTIIWTQIDIVKWSKFSATAHSVKLDVKKCFVSMGIVGWAQQKKTK